MNLKGIVAVSGKPGLWKALAQNKTGFILESLDAQKTKLVANVTTAKLAALDEITVFGNDGDLKLTDILTKMKAEASIPDGKSEGMVLRRFFREVAPDHDEVRVYASDMKKIIGWFNILKDMPLFNEVTEQPVVEPEPVVEHTEPVVEEPVAEAKPIKAKAAKAQKLAETSTDDLAVANSEAAKPKAAPKKKKTEV